MTVTGTSICMQCQSPMRGRTDKKFCDDHCRNKHNNQLKAVTNNLVRNINHALVKNRRILETCLLNGQAMAKVSRRVLLQEGFQFRYVTHYNSNKTGSLYYCCYDYAYLLLEEEYCLICKIEEE